ncbi:MAG TPA: hypothetical protein DEH78_21765 [Solibacterales bacterium]|nr:hypothetical protein [Bryobacterales bacterium]
MKQNTALPLVALALAAVSAASGATLTASPVFQQIGTSGTVTIGAGQLGPNRLGGYDFLVSWDATIVALSQVTFLAPGEFDGLGQWELLDVGLASVRAVFFAGPEELIASQPESFALAELTFSAVSRGISPVDLEIVELTDAFAEPFEAGVSNAEIEVIPEPGSLGLLLAAALAGALRAARGPMSRRQFR